MGLSFTPIHGLGVLQHFYRFTARARRLGRFLESSIIVNKTYLLIKNKDIKNRKRAGVCTSKDPDVVDSTIIS